MNKEELVTAIANALDIDITIDELLKIDNLVSEYTNSILGDEMFKYHGGVGKKDAGENGLWRITYEDGTKDVAMILDTAIQLCDRRLTRASI
jgi:hypothetical protein